MPQKPWISIVKLLIVLGGFATIIIVIARTLSHNCNDNTKMFDKGMNECRKICDYDTKPGCTDCTHWDYATKTCKLCPVGMTWNNDTGVCVQNCNDNGGWWGGSEGLQYNNSGCMCSSSFLGTNCSVFSHDPQQAALGYMQCDLECIDTVTDQTTGKQVLTQECTNKNATAVTACAAAANGKVGPGCCPPQTQGSTPGTCGPAITLDGFGSRCVPAKDAVSPAPIMVITATDQSGHVVHSGIPTNADYLNVTFLCYMSTPPPPTGGPAGSSGILQEVAPGNFTEDSVVLECSTGNGGPGYNIYSPFVTHGLVPGPTSCRCKNASYFNNNENNLNDCIQYASCVTSSCSATTTFDPTKCWNGAASGSGPDGANCPSETLEPLMSKFTPVFGPGTDWPIAPNPRNYKFTARINKPEWAANLPIGNPNTGDCMSADGGGPVDGKNCLFTVNSPADGADGGKMQASGYVSITVPKQKFKNINGVDNVASVPFEWWFCAVRPGSSDPKCV